MLVIEINWRRWPIRIRRGVPPMPSTPKAAVKLYDEGPTWIPVVKAVRKHAGFNRRDAKIIVKDSPKPRIVTVLPLAQALRLVDAMRQAGADVEVRR